MFGFSLVGGGDGVNTAIGNEMRNAGEHTINEILNALVYLPHESIHFILYLIHLRDIFSASYMHGLRLSFQKTL